MSVVIETTIGDITVDLFLKERPRATLNFLKLCKLKYYNFNLFHTVQHGFIAQTGDPSGSGDGGSSVWGVLEGKHKRYFEGETVPKIKHTEPGLLSMVCAGEGLLGSQFFFTLGPELLSLDGGGHCVIGEVTEGHEVLRKLSEVICDEKHRPYKDVRVTHTMVLEDPFEDPRGFRVPSRSPSPSAERLAGGRIAADEEIDDTEGKSAEEIAEMMAEKEAKARATILEIVGDIPDAEMAPPENVLFVCKLNPVTTDDDLQIIFSRFGKIVGCEVIRDKVSGDSLQYAFIEFEDKKSCEDAYFKMDNVLIDDRRIHVDFSQSVAKLRWRGKGRGIEYLDGTDKKSFKDIEYKDERRDRKRAPSRLRKSTSSAEESERESRRSRSRTRSSRRSPRRSPRRGRRTPRKHRGGKRRRRSPWRRGRAGRGGGGGGGGGAGGGGKSDKKVQLSEDNSAHMEERNGRDIRVVAGMVDYKNRPYPTSFIKRNAPPGGGGGGGSGESSANRRRNRSRSPLPFRNKRRSRSRSPLPFRRRSRSRSPLPLRRRTRSRSPLPFRRVSRSRSPLPLRRRDSRSRSPLPLRRRDSRSLSPVRHRQRSYSPEPVPRRNISPSPGPVSRHSRRRSRDYSGAESSDGYDRRRKDSERRRRSSSSGKRKSKPSSSSKRYSSGSESDGSGGSDRHRRHKSKKGKKDRK
uniref:Peptidyl-prolyl cis-trans isomerase n=5 Tax=Culex pipiens TaxID=7175 RepID=A0A8D8G3T8_CULPI